MAKRSRDQVPGSPPRPAKGRAAAPRSRRAKATTLRDLAEKLSLSPATVSLVLNRSPAADAIPPETHERVRAAARELSYRPNYLARSLRSQRSYSVGVLVPEISEPYAAEVMSGIESHLLRAGYHYLVASHRRSNSELLDDYLDLLERRAVEGLILIASEIAEAPRLPTVVVSGHIPLEGVTNLVIDHDRAAEMTLSHLKDLGHRRIAFFKGQPGSSDTEDRWRALLETAPRLGLEVRPELTLQLSGEGEAQVFLPEDGYQEGYTFARRLIERRADFSALFAWDDVSAIGATRAFLDAGLGVPADVSVVGFDDIQSAAFQNPSLTTVRQPLRTMGESAARLLLEHIASPGNEHGGFVTVQPELVVRGSTGPAARPSGRGARRVPS